MKCRYGVALAIACLLCNAGPGIAQKATLPLQSNASALIGDGMARPPHLEQEAQQQGTTVEDDMGTSGFFLGIVGMLAGAAIGSQVGQSACPSKRVDKDCMGRHAYTGALVAGSLLTPVGVHIANKRPKNLLLSMAASALTGTALYYGFKAVPGSPIAMAPFLAAPLQVFLSVKLEQPDSASGSSRRRAVR